MDSRVVDNMTIIVISVYFIILLLFICLLQLGWRPVPAATYMYTNINQGSNVLETGGAAWEASVAT